MESSLKKAKLIFNKVLHAGNNLPGGMYRFSRAYHLRVWDDNRVEFRCMGYGSVPGWTAVGIFQRTPPVGINWSNRPKTDAHDRSVITEIMDEFSKWGLEYTDALQEESLEEDAEWALL